MPVVVQRQVCSLRGNVIDISVVAQRQFPLVQKTIEIHQLQFIDTGPASSGAVGEETVELPQLQPVQHGNCCCMPVVCNDRWRVVQSAENCEGPAVAAHLTRWSMSLLAQFIDGLDVPVIVH